MMASDTAAILAQLPDDAEITVTVRVGDWLRAREARSGGPATLSTTMAAKLLGYSAERWRRWAKAGVLAGAWQDTSSGDWHLPRTACEAQLRRMQARGRTPTPVDPSALEVRRRPRGPWKNAALDDAARANSIPLRRARGPQRADAATSARPQTP